MITELPFENVYRHGFARVAACTIPVAVADPATNAEAVLASARRMLDEADNIRLIAEDLRNDRGGRLTVATSHLHARYTLLAPVKAFRERYPEVQLQLIQADADEVPRMIEANEADVGISTDVTRTYPALALLPCGTVEVRTSVA